MFPISGRESEGAIKLNSVTRKRSSCRNVRCLIFALSVLISNTATESGFANEDKIGLIETSYRVISLNYEDLTFDGSRSYHERIVEIVQEFLESSRMREKQEILNRLKDKYSRYHGEERYAEEAIGIMSMNLYWIDKENQEENKKEGLRYLIKWADMGSVQSIIILLDHYRTEAETALDENKIKKYICIMGTNVDEWSKILNIKNIHCN